MKRVSIYQDCGSKKPVEQGKAEYELNGADDDKEGEGDGVNKSLGVNWNQRCMKKGGDGQKNSPDMKFVISPVVNRCLALLLSLNDFL